MKTLPITLLFSLLSGLALQAQTLPSTPKRPVTDVYFGKAVVDNYRWLEEMNSPETKNWFKSQGDYTQSILDRISGRDSLVNTFVQYDALKPALINQIKRKGGRYFYRKTLASENAGKIYYRQGKTGAEILLFDPATYDRTKKYTVTGFIPSEDGRKLALGVTEGGAEVSTLRIMNVDTKTFFPESIPAVFGGEVTGWTSDSKAFTYTPENSTDPNDLNRSVNTRSLYHVVGTDPKTDKLLFSRAKYPALGIKPEEFPLVFFTEDFKYIVGYLASVDWRLSCFIAPASELLQPAINWKRLAAPEDSIKNGYVVNNQLYLHSVKGTNKGKVLVTDVRQPNVRSAKVIMEEGKHKIQEISVGKDFLFVNQNDGVNSSIRQLDTRTGEWAEIGLPLSGSALLWAYDTQTNDFQLYVTGWKQPATRYDYDPVTKKVSISPFHIEARYPGLTELIVEEIEIPSHDGKMVPLSIVYNRNLKKNGSAACFMSGYGAYGNSQIPYFSTRHLAMLNKGVVLAVPHVRGGSEKGEDWYKDGYKTTKPNTWKDFIACGEYLVKNGYTSVGKLIGEGTSAGGVLIGRAITERPDLFAAAISNVGLNNALRMENSANGPANIPEFGTVKDSVECRALYEMDAMQHVKEGVKYPAVMCVAGMNDPRVVAWQPGKFAAALQSASTSGKPVLLQVNFDNGHFTEEKQVTFRNFANMYAFGLWQAGHPDFQPKEVFKK